MEVNKEKKEEAKELYEVFIEYWNDCQYGDRKPEDLGGFPIKFLDPKEKQINNIEIDVSLDYLFDLIDELMLQGDFEIIDNFLLFIVSLSQVMPVDILMGCLTITLPTKRLLKNRKDIFKITEYKLKEGGESLLNLEGLE